MNDAQSTIVGLKAQDCPGGGWNGMPADLERATVADCLAHGVCGCIYGDAVQNIEQLQTALKIAREQVDANAHGRTATLMAIDGALNGGDAFADPEQKAREEK